VKIGRQEIQLRRTTPRNMAAGRLSGLLMQAFRHLGKEHITTKRMEHFEAYASGEGAAAVVERPAARPRVDASFVSGTGGGMICETGILQTPRVGTGPDSPGNVGTARVCCL
jgi:hypothetical protein